MLFPVFICGITTAFPAGVACIISSKTKFKIAGINIYRLASDFVLGIGLSAWFYLLGSIYLLFANGLNTMKVHHIYML